MASRKLEIQIVGDAASLRRTLGQARGDVNKFDRSLGGSRKAMSAFGVHARQAGAAAAAIIPAIAVKQTVDFDKSMRNVNSIAQLSEKRFKAVSAQVLKLAGPTAQAPDALAKSMYDLVSSGFSANQSLKIVNKSARAATAGLTTAEISTKALAAVLNSYKLPASQAGKVSDQLFQTVKVGVISFEALSAEIGDVLPVAASLGVGLDQVGASIATMTKAGISAPETMTKIKNIMVTMIKPGDALQAALKKLGVNSGEALIKQRGLQGALQALIGTTDGSKRAVAKLFPEQRALAGAMALTGKNTRGAKRDLDAMRGSAGATGKALSQQSKSVSFQWNRLKSQVSAVGIEIGTKLIPILSTVIGVALKVQRNISRSFRAVGRLLVEVWDSPKRAFGNFSASILRGFAKVFDAASRLPVIGKRFEGVAAKTRRWADQLDRIGEKKNLRVNVKIKATFDDVALGAGKIGGSGSGWPLEEHIRNKTAAHVKNNPGLMAKLASGLGGAAKGGTGLNAFNAIGRRFGLTIGSGFRPGDDGYHGVSRARDFPGPAPAMLKFARFMAATFGRRLKELIHTPMGFSIKDGQRVAPYAQADHFDHVHVAMRRGGMVGGQGSGDRVPAMLEPGEHVIRKSVATKIRPLLDALNVQHMRKGGKIEGIPGIFAQEVRSAGLKGRMARTVFGAMLRANSVEAGGIGNNPAGGDRDSIGVFQIRGMHGSAENRADPRWSARWFINTAKGIYQKGMSGAQLAAAVERPQENLRYKYGSSQFVNEGQVKGLVGRFSGGAGGGAGGTKETAAEKRSRTPVSGRSGISLDEAIDLSRNRVTGAEGTKRTSDDVSAIKGLSQNLAKKAKALRARLAKINKALKGKLTPGVRERLLGERSGIFGELGSISGERIGLRGQVGDLRREPREARRTALAGIKDQLGDLASSAAAAWRAGIEKGIDSTLAGKLKSIAGGADSTALNAILGRQSGREDATNQRDLERAERRLASARAAGVSPKRLEELEGAVDEVQARILEKRIAAQTDAANKEADAARDGLDQQEADLGASLGRSLSILFGNLEGRRVAYADFVKQVRGILGPFGGDFAGSAEDAAALAPQYLTDRNSTGWGKALASSLWNSGKRGGPKWKEVIRLLGFDPRVGGALNFRGLAGGGTVGDSPVWVGERGPELAILPRGTNVRSHEESKRMAGGSMVTMTGPVTIRSGGDMERMASRLAFKIAHA